MDTKNDTQTTERDQTLPRRTSSRQVGRWSKKELLALPHRKWDETSAEYTSILVFSTGRKHDSGWACIAIIGCRQQVPVEICSLCSDDIEWKMPPAKIYGSGYTRGQYRSDCVRKSGALHFWSNDGGFKVGAALSSIEIEFIPSENK